MTSSPQDSSPAERLHAAEHSPAQSVDLPATALPRLDPSVALNSDLRTNPRFQVFQLRSTNADLDRQITVYVPEAYTKAPKDRFPVLYLHDGQNLFDDSTSFLHGHTWHAHTTADTLIAAGRVQPLILVGIANAGIRRMPEYTPTPDPNFGGGSGNRYGELLLQEIKPLVDCTWRTLPDRANTGMGGSSLGGLISLYLALTHRDVFSRIAVVSPSIWWDRRSILSLVRKASPEPPLRIWLDMGTAEGARHLHDTDQLYGILLDRGWNPEDEVTYQRVPEGAHNEDAWAARFGDILTFLFPANRPATAPESQSDSIVTPEPWPSPTAASPEA